MGLSAGTTENATWLARCSQTYVARGLDVEQGVLFAIDGSKALRKAIRQVFGDEVPVQRCVRHKERDVLGTRRGRPRPSQAAARRRGRNRSRQGARASCTASLSISSASIPARHVIAEGMAETLTVTRLGITGKLKLTLQSTDPCESMISRPRDPTPQRQGRTSGGCALAGRRRDARSRDPLPRVEGYRGLAQLAVKVEPTSSAAATTATTTSTALMTITRPSPPKIHDDSEQQAGVSRPTPSRLAPTPAGVAVGRLSASRLGDRHRDRSDRPPGRPPSVEWSHGRRPAVAAA